MTRSSRLRPVLLAALCVLAAALLAGCGSSGASKTKPGATQTIAAAPESGPAREKVTVDITDFKFVDPVVTVKAGGTVTWENMDDATHDAVAKSSAPKKFKTKDLKDGDQDTVTFDKPGAYPYFCQFHPFMNGTVKVVQ